jgi:c-di-AMP phosphodiesterase-like protein
MKKAMQIIDSFFNWIADMILWLCFIALIIGAIYLSYRIKINITKEAIQELNQESNQNK